MIERISINSEVYLSAQRFCMFLKDFEKFNNQEKKICIERIRNRYPEQVMLLINYFVSDMIDFSQYLQMKEGTPYSNDNY